MFDWLISLNDRSVNEGLMWGGGSFWKLFFLEGGVGKTQTPEGKWRYHGNNRDDLTSDSRWRKLTPTSWYYCYKCHLEACPETTRRCNLLISTRLSTPHRSSSPKTWDVLGLSSVAVNICHRSSPTNQLTSFQRGCSSVWSQQGGLATRRQLTERSAWQLLT